VTAAPDSPGLTLTGERTVPGQLRENYWFRRHEAAYAWLIEQFPPAGGTLVDAGSGEGYGAQMLRDAGASRVIALEYDESAAAHAALAYPMVRTVRANLDALPLPDRSIDMLVTMQVVEHLWDLPRFLRECRRVLRPGGLIAAATPNRPTFSPGLGRGERPANPFHVEEFDAEQVAQMLSGAGFADVRVWGVHHGPRIAPDIVARQIAAVLEDAWTPDLLAEVGAVTSGDFVVDAVDPGAGLDLIGVGRAPGAS